MRSEVWISFGDPFHQSNSTHLGPLAFSTVQGSGASDATSYVGSSAQDAIVIVDSAGSYFLGGQQSADTLTFSTSANPLYSRVVDGTTAKGGQGADTFAFSSAAATTYTNAFFNGNADVDTFTFGAGAATESLIASTIQGGNGVDTFTDGQVLGLASARLNGNKANDVINLDGVIATSNIFGGQGNDAITLSGATTSTLISGDLDNDTITVDAAVSLDGSSVMGGQGIDRLLLNAAGVAGTTVFVNGNEGTDTIQGTLAGNASLFGGSGVDTIVANGAATTIVGGTGLDIITAGGGADRIYYTATGQGESGTAANSTTAQVGDTITGFTTGTDFVGFDTSELLTGSSATAAAVAQNTWNLNNTGVAVVTGAAAATDTTAALLLVSIGTVTGDAGDTAYVVTTGGGGATSAIAQVTLGSAKAGVALNAADTITFLGTSNAPINLVDVQLF